MKRGTPLATMLLLTAVALAPLLRADGSDRSVVTLDVAARAELVRAVARERARYPEDFAAVARVRDAVVRARAQARGRRVPMALWLRPLGKRSVMPLLELVASDEPAIDPAAARDLRVGAVEALGSLRDPRAAPVLRALLTSSTLSPDLERATVAALGRIADDASSELLARLVERSGSSQLVVLTAAGECRRLVVARALARVARESGDVARTRLAARALGEIGSAWAWRTAVVAQSGEQDATRSLAARVLVDVFVTHEGAVRAEAKKSLLLVAHPSSAALVRAAQRGADPALRAELQSLLGALERSPIEPAP